jgi:glycosyltransferase involved in cell wall biosynthesis
MKASVIIPTRNRADTLARCLESLTCQTLPAEAFEVLVIDNGSTDHTPDVAEKYNSLLQLTYITAPEPGLHVGRHEGMRQASSDVLIFADDDIKAEPGWVEAVVQTLENPKIALVGGNNYPLFEESPPEWLVRWWERPVYKGRALGSLSILDFGEGHFEIDPGYVWGCNYSIRRESLLKAGGFHPDGVPKERLLFRGDGETHVSNMVRKYGFRTVFNSRASVWHFVPSNRMTKEYFEQRAYAQGISDSYSAIRQSGGLKVIIGRRLVRRFASFRPSVESFIRIITSKPNQALHELLKIQRSLSVAYWEGYEFHRREARRDPALLSWILKEDYLS